MKLTYSEQLRHPNWQRRRLERLEASNFRCEICRDTQTTLHVHHRFYIRGRMAWEYTDEQLRVVCEPCHADQHVLVERLAGILSYAECSQIVGLLAGMHEYLSKEAPSDVEIDAAQMEDPFMFEIGRVVSAMELLAIEDVMKLGKLAERMFHRDYSASVRRVAAQKKLQRTDGALSQH